MEFGVLGPLVVTGTSRDDLLGGPKQRALVALLLLNANGAVSRDRLIAGIWGEHPPPSAEHTLDNYLSRVRKLLGSDRILRRPEGYALRVDPEELDLERFETGLAQGMGHAKRDPVAAADCLNTALALWRGPALADLADQPFAAEAAAWLEERRLLAVEEYAAVMLALGRAGEAVELLEPLVTLHPFRERLRGQLMRGLYLDGRQARALAVYADGRRQFAEELGIEPGEDLQRLHRAVLAQDPDLQPEGSWRRSTEDPAPPPSRTPGSLRRTKVAVLVAAVVGLVAVVAITVPSDHDRSPALEPGLRTVTLDQVPSAIALGFGSLWFAMPARSEVLRVDVGSGQVSDRVRVGAAGVVAVGGQAVWSAGVPSNAIDQIDPDAGTVVRTIGLGSARVGALAFGGDTLWVADAVHDVVIEVDPHSGLVKRRMPLALKPTSLIVDGEALWVADYANAEVAQVDLTSGQIVARLHVGGGPTALAVGSDALWVVNSLDSTVSRVNPEVSAVVATIPVGSGPVGIAERDGDVWVANQYSASLSRINPATNTVINTAPTDGDPAAVALVDNTPWVATVPVLGGRGGTLRLLHSRRITLDPAFQTDLLPLLSDRLLRSTLVAYRHVGGPAGTQVVPDLAVAVPTPSGNATTFAFRLRPGIVYSDGRPVVASDFRRALERVVALRTETSANFMNIKGAEACVRADESCDLSTGIDTDDATGAVIFHLIEPDPDFVAQLTASAAAPVPPATPYRDMGLDPIPGTGPYVVASVSATEVRYVRSPHFTERSHSAQPDGLADEITLELEESRDKQTAAVVSGGADWAAYIAMEQLPDLRVKIPDRIHRASIPTTDFFQFNLQLAPFDDIRVRQALNLAVDRDRIVELYGGPDLATPTCQVLPPGIPGYSPLCPFTRVPTKSGAWREPDLRRARQLVAASGTRGANVTVWGFTDDPTIRPEVVRYVASVLRDLGYEATVRLQSRGDFDLPHARIQIISGAWGGDTAHGTLTTWFSCAGAGSHGFFCDPKVESELLRARAAVATDPREAQRIWASLDRYVTEQAGWLPMISEGGLEIVSDRLGNYQFNPYWGFIADQASLE